nr:neprilysin-1-like [Rhipicephalus microplus]
MYARGSALKALSNLSTWAKAQQQRGVRVTNGAASVYSSGAYEPGAHVTNGTQGVFTVSGQLDTESQCGRNSTKRRCCGKKAMVAGGIITTFLVIAGVVLGTVFGLDLVPTTSGHHAEPSTGPAVLPGPPCDTEQCQAVSTLYSRTLSEKHDPCDDFHKHVCTRWKLAPSSKLTSVFRQQALWITRSVIASLRNTSVPTDGQTAIQKVAGLFQSCVDLFGDDEHAPSGQNPSVDILNFLRERKSSFEAQSDVDAAYLMLDFPITYGLPTLFNVRVDTIPGNAERLHVILSMRRSLYDGQHATHKAIEEHLRWLGLDAALIRQLTPTIETIDDYLLKLGRDAYEDEEPDARNRSVLLLRTMEKAILGRKGGNWNHYLGNITNGLLPGEHYVTFETRYLVLFLTKVFRMIPNLNDLRIWISFDLSRQLRQMVHVSRTGSFTMSSPISQWESSCLKHTSKVMDKAAYAALYHRLINTDTIFKAQEMVSSIAESLKTEIAESSWMEDGTREIAVRKLVKMNKVVGYPEGVEDDESLNKYYEMFDNTGPSFVNSWLSASRSASRKALERLSEHPAQVSVNDDMAMVNSIYKPPLNTMVVGMGLLLPPFFGTVPAVDYASAGHLAAHEMMHAFDVSNRRRDDNYVERDWWTPASKAEYEKRVECIRGSMGEELSAPDDITDSEMMADFIGIFGLYNAYLKAKQVPDASLELQGLPGVTSDQLFFIALCYKWCSNSRATERYPDFSVRCNMPLMNMPQFSEAFNCSAESRMNPPEKCTFW